MPQQAYPGQFKFRVTENIKLAKRRVDTQKRMVKLRQKQSDKQTAKANSQPSQSKERMIKLRQQQREQNYDKSILAQQVMITQAIQR